MSSSVLYPSFKDAQQLYTQYSTLENISILTNHIKNVIDSSFLSTMAEQNIHAIYNNIILQYYPNEICIKANFIKQVLMKGKSHVTIFELPVGSSRVDLCKINGTSVAYEIKTDLDNFNRLEKQIKDYNKIFEEVYIICSELNIDNIISVIPETCGVYSYKQTKSGRYIFKIYRAAQKNAQLETTKQLQILRKTEFYQFFKISTDFFNKKDLIEITRQLYDEAFINRVFKQILKKRFEKQWTFLKQNYKDIYEIDYQWFYKNQVEPSRIYK
ncbi:MAG: sce7726 family protein [Bacteroidales bacterium]|nr:sce7726 family protein [Clostridium sp.]MCM1203399.1 sce7726 family protein [Bacteroidales bacterium]